MAEELVMPRLSDTMERGTVSRWLKQEGDAVAAGEVVAEIETDKATMEYQSDVEGTLLRILVGDGESADLGAPIGLVGEPGEATPSGDGDGGEAPAAGAAGDGDRQEGEARAQEPVTRPARAVEDRPAAEDRSAAEDRPAGRDVDERADGAGENGAGGPLRVSPIARRMADEAGVDLTALAGRGSGPEGRIVKADVERLAAERRDRPRPAPAPAAAPTPEGEVVQPSGMLRAVARRMAEAKATVPHFYLQAEIDMVRAVALRRELNEGLAEAGEKVSVNDLVIRACARALAAHPEFHRSWTEAGIVLHPHANVGVAVALDEGLIVPVIRNAEEKGVRQLAREARDLVGRARAGRLKQSEIEGGTFTVSNLGMFGITSFGAIINPPEPGILAVGNVVERPVVVEGQVVVRPIMAVTLSVDHRACSGADGARFLATVRRHLEGGVLLLA